MLKTQSFKMSDSEGMNALLDKYPLAQGMHILVSNGEVIIPFHNGEPETLDCKVITIKEQINSLLVQKELIEQTRRYLRRATAEKRVRLDELQANIAEAENSKNAKGKTQTIKEMKDVEAVAINALKQDDNQLLMNDREVERLNLNIEVLTDRIKELRNEKA